MLWRSGKIGIVIWRVISLFLGKLEFIYLWFSSFVFILDFREILVFVYEDIYGDVYYYRGNLEVVYL